MAVFAYDNYRVHAKESSRRLGASLDPPAGRGTPTLQPTAAPLRGRRERRPQPERDGPSGCSRPNQRALSRARRGTRRAATTVEVSSGSVSSVEGAPPVHGFSRSRFLVPALGAASAAALALLGFFVAACALAILVLILPRVSAGALNVRVFVWMLAGVAFLVPDRFAMAGALPIDLEPYRILFGLITLLWLVVLLTNPDARLHRTMVDLPLLLIFASILVSVVANPERANRFDQSIMKALLLFTTYILLVYLICSVFDSLEHTRRFISVLVALGTVVAGCAVVESATGYNVFDEWSRTGLLSAIPRADIGEIGRGGATRALASASHPIALGVLLAMLVPLAAYLAHRDRRWLISVIALPAGILATVSRTPLIMLLVILLVLAFMRPAESVRLVVVLGLGDRGVVRLVAELGRRGDRCVLPSRRNSPPSKPTPPRAMPRPVAGSPT